MNTLINTINHFGPSPVGGWFCFVMLLFAFLAAFFSNAGGETAGHFFARATLLTVFAGMGVGWFMGF